MQTPPRGRGRVRIAQAIGSVERASPREAETRETEGEQHELRRVLREQEKARRRTVG